VSAAPAPGETAIRPMWPVCEMSPATANSISRPSRHRETQVGRVDLSNLPGFLDYQSNPSFPGETALLRNYLNKDHNFRHGSSAFAAARSWATTAETRWHRPRRVRLSEFSPIVGEPTSPISTFRTTTPRASGSHPQDQRLLFALGCGAGAYNTCPHRQPRAILRRHVHRSRLQRHSRVIVMLFGSGMAIGHSGQHPPLVLATPTYGLAAMYTGVPHWFLHPLGLGETLATARGSPRTMPIPDSIEPRWFSRP